MTSENLKVVIDTNILVDSTHDDFSYAKKIIDMVLKDEITAFVSHAIVRENQLLLKKTVPEKKQRQFLQNYFSKVREVNITFALQVVRFDSEDDKYINTALSARAEYIITSDSHLLEIDGYQGLKIMRPKDFWSQVKGEENSWREWAQGIMR